MIGIITNPTITQRLPGGLAYVTLSEGHVSNFSCYAAHAILSAPITYASETMSVRGLLEKMERSFVYEDDSITKTLISQIEDEGHQQVEPSIANKSNVRITKCLWSKGQFYFFTDWSKKDG